MWYQAVASGNWREDGTSGMCGTHDVERRREGGERDTYSGHNNSLTILLLVMSTGNSMQRTLTVLSACISQTHSSLTQS